MPQWLRWLSTVNPLSYEVNALRTLLIGMPSNGLLDMAVLVVPPSPALRRHPACCGAWCGNGRASRLRCAECLERPNTRGQQ